MAKTIAEIRNHFNKLICLKDPCVIGITMGCVVANNFQTDQVSMFLTGPASSAKSEIIQSFERYPQFYPMEKLTVNTFMSGIGNQESLLFRLSNEGRKIIGIKEFSVILQKAKEHRGEIISQIRGICDGHTWMDSGAPGGRRIEWKGKMAFLIGSVEAIEIYTSVISELGERFLYNRITNEGIRKEQCERAMEAMGKEEMIREQIKDEVNEFLSQPQFQNPKLEDVHISGDMKENIFELADFIAIARTSVSKDRNRVIRYVPKPEGSGRLTKQLLALGCGICLVQGKKDLDKDVYSLLCKVARDTIPSNRNIVLEVMYDNKFYDDTWGTTEEIHISARLPSATTYYVLEDLFSFNAVDQRQDPNAKGTYQWRLNSQMLEIINNVGVYYGEEVTMP